MFKLVKSMKKDGKDVEGGRYMRGSNSRLSFSEKDRGKVWKEHMERIMNEENEWNQNVEADLVEWPVERVSREEVVKAMGEMKAGKPAGPLEVSVEMIAVSGEIGIGVMVELCQGVLDGRGMPDEWAMSVVVPIFKGKGDTISWGHIVGGGGVKLLEHAMKIVEKVLESRLRRMVKVDNEQFGFMPRKGTIDAVFILRKLQEEYLDKEKKLYTCFVDLEKAFDRVPREVLEWAMRKRGWMKFRECGELLNSKRFSLKVKGMVYRSYVRVAMLYGSERWCLRENEIAILRRTERAMCGAKLMEKKRTKDLMEMLRLKETVVQMAKASGVKWYGHVLRRDDGHVLRKALEFEVKGEKKGEDDQDVEDASGGEQERWFGEKGRHESSKMKSGS